MDNLANFIAIFFVLHVAWSYYFNCIRKGYTMDVWHYSLIMNAFVIHVMLPFSRSDLNVFALGPTLLRLMQPQVNQAYFISALGYAGILLGGQIWRFKLGVGLRRSFAGLIESVTKGSLLLLRSRNLLLFHGVLSAALIICLLAYYFSVAGFGLNFGGLILVSPALRPIAQFATFYAFIIVSYAISRFIRYREREMLIIALAIEIGLFFFGSRSAILSSLMLPILVAFITYKRRIRLIYLLLAIFGGLLGSVLLDALRKPDFSVSAVMGGALLSIFYGNSFSDTRDFAVILSFWDGHFFYGKTYLAGIMAFVPRFLSAFRDTWSLGVVTATMAGFKTTEHAGLRIGLVGEAYLNFGLIAVLLLGMFVGASTRLMDLRMKQSAEALPASGMRVYSYYVMSTLIFAVVNTSTASTLYSTLFIFLASWLLVKVSRLSNSRIF